MIFVVVDLMVLQLDQFYLNHHHQFDDVMMVYHHFQVYVNLVLDLTKMIDYVLDNDFSALVSYLEKKHKKSQKV